MLFCQSSVRDTGICTFIKPKPLKGHGGTCVIQPSLRPLRQSASSLIGSSNDLCVCLLRQLTFSKSGPQRLTCEDNCHRLHYVSSVGSCHVSSVSAHFPDMRQKPVSANWGGKGTTAANVSYSRRTHTHVGQLEHENTIQEEGLFFFLQYQVFN